MIFQQLIYKLYQFFRALLDLPQKPILHHAYQCPHIYFCQQGQLPVAGLIVQFCDNLQNRIFYNGVDICFEKAFQMLPA